MRLSGHYDAGAELLDVTAHHPRAADITNHASGGLAITNVVPSSMSAPNAVTEF